MGVLSKGTDFTNGDQVTDTSLDNLVDNATFTTSAVDEVSTDIGGTGSIIVKDGGITTGKLADSTSAATGVTSVKIATSAVTAAKIGTNAVTTAKILDDNVTTAKILNANVTKAKIENLTDYTVLGNVSGGAAAPAEVTILDEDTLVTDSATALATQQSIKAYVDTATTAGFVPSTYAGGESVTLPNGFIMKFGTKSVGSDGTAAVSFATAFPGGIAQVQLTFQTTINVGSDAGLSASSQSVTGFTIQNGAANTETVAWMAIGY